MSDANELIKYEEPKIVEMYSNPNGLNPIIDEIKKQTTSIVFNMDVKKDRDECKSLAYQIKRSKAFLDGVGKSITEEWRIQTNKVNSERTRIKKELDEIESQVRAPLTNWENEEKERVAKLKQRVIDIELLGEVRKDGSLLSLEALERNLQVLSKIEVDDSFQEEKFNALRIYDQSKRILTEEIVRTKQVIKEREELEQLRKDKEERDRKDREEQLKKEAAEKARLEAEEKAEKEKERIRLEKEEAEKREQAAKERAEKAEKEKIEADKRAEQERIDAKKREEEAKIKAKKDQEEAEERAAERERQKIKEENERKETERKKREADLAHKHKINSEIVQALASYGIKPEQSEALIEGIVNGTVPHLNVNY